jgi:hypothetical protein
MKTRFLGVFPINCFGRPAKTLLCLETHFRVCTFVEQLFKIAKRKSKFQRVFQVFGEKNNEKLHGFSSKS